MIFYLLRDAWTRTCRLSVPGLLGLALLGNASCKKESTIPTIIIPPPAPSSAVVVAPGDAVVYEAYVRDASSEGTFDGLSQRLDSIKRLGCNVVWLMPIHPIGVARRVGSLGSPYSVSDYKAVNTEYGNLAAFDRFVAAAHQKNMAVVLDWVANHTAWDHAWITQHPDWYTHDGTGAIIPPLNTGWNDVADLNYDQPALRTEMIAAMRFWVENHSVDGFRCDAADMLPDGFWSAAIDSLKRVRANLFWLAEGSAPSHYTSGFQLNYGWDFYAALKQVFNENAPASTLTVVSARELIGVPAGHYRLRFTTNHDFTSTEGTPTELFGSDAAAQAAYVATLAYGATPLLYSGQEAGDPTRLSLFERHAIDWNHSPAATAFYRRVLTAYDSLPALRTGTAAGTNASPDAVTVLRTLGSKRVAVFVNTRNSALTLTIPSGWPATAWTDALTGSAVPASTTLSLPAYGYAIWKGGE